MAKRVLAADDNPLIRKMLCQLFEREDDHDICAEARNGQEAIELALKHRPDLYATLKRRRRGEEAKENNACGSNNLIYSTRDGDNADRN